uniref:oligosaccharide flippase family protein n=1 Tax=uncultured Sphingomonas sp. TaxID=158754 RepID=UPI0035C957CB
MSEPSLKSKVVSGASWSFLDNFSQQVLSLIIFVIIGRILSPALFGIVSTALVFVQLMSGTILPSLATGMVTLRDPVDEDYDTGFWLCLGVGGFTMVVLIAVAEPLARAYHIAELANVVRAVSVIVLITGLSYAHSAWARRNFMFRALAMRHTVSTFIAGAIGITVAVAGYGLAALVLNQVISAAIGLALLWRAIPWRPKVRFSRRRARTILATAVPLGINQSLQFIAQNFDTALVTFLMGPLSGGLYAAAKRVITAIQLGLWGPMSSVVLPAFAEVSADATRFGNVAIRMSRLVMALTAPLFAGIALTAPYTMVVLFGHKWLGAAPTMQVLGTFAIFAPSLSLINQVVIALGRAKLILVFTALQVALSLGAIALVGGGRDPAVIALCLWAPTLVVFILTLVTLRLLTAFPVRRYLIAIGAPLLCTAIMAGAVLAIPDLHAGPLVQLVVLAGVGGITYGIAALLIARAAVAEIFGFLRPLIPQRLKTKLGMA